MRLRVMAGLIALVLPAVAEAVPSTLLSAGTLEPGRFGAHGGVGFPWLSAQVTYGVAENFDASAEAKIAWADIQRVGVGARYRFVNTSDMALAVRGGASTWIARPASTRWIDVTGESDYTGTLALAFTYATPRGTVLTLDGALLLVGNTRPRTDPLQPPPGPVAWGVNAAFRALAELPHESGFVLTVTVGADLHTSGFDDALAMPVFGVGVGWR